MAGYFTILTNALITLRMLATAYGWRISASTAANLLLSILMVGIIYHLLLTPRPAPHRGAVVGRFRPAQRHAAGLPRLVAGDCAQIHRLE